jgi:hypothetical protein
VQSAGATPEFTERFVLSQAEIELAITQKDWTTALEGFASHLDLVGGTGQRWEIARTYLGWGDVHLARGAAGDLERAREKFHQALVIFTKIGADGYINLLNQRLARFESSPVPAES